MDPFKTLLLNAPGTAGSSVAITGGSINGTNIGATTPGTGAFTTVTASSTTASTTTGTGSIINSGGFGNAGAINAGGGITTTQSSTGLAELRATNSNASGYSGVGIVNTGASGRWWTIGVGGNTAGNASLRQKLYVYDETSAAIRSTMDTNGNYVLSTGDIELETIGKGVIIKSPDGTRWRVTVSNAGAMVVAAA